MYIVYVLQDDRGKMYKGVTNDLNRRMKEHSRGKTRTTRHMQNLKVIYTENHVDFQSARQRELYMKSAAGRRYLNEVMGV